MSCTFWNLRRRRQAVTVPKEVKIAEKTVASKNSPAEAEKPVKKGGVKNGK